MNTSSKDIAEVAILIPMVKIGVALVFQLIRFDVRIGVDVALVLFQKERVEQMAKIANANANSGSWRQFKDSTS